MPDCLPVPSSGWGRPGASRARASAGGRALGVSAAGAVDGGSRGPRRPCRAGGAAVAEGRGRREGFVSGIARLHIMYTRASSRDGKSIAVPQLGHLKRAGTGGFVDPDRKATGAAGDRRSYRSRCRSLKSRSTEPRILARALSRGGGPGRRRRRGASRPGPPAVVPDRDHVEPAGRSPAARGQVILRAACTMRRCFSPVTASPGDPNAPVRPLTSMKQSISAVLRDEVDLAAAAPVVALQDP